VQLTSSATTAGTRRPLAAQPDWGELTILRQVILPGAVPGLVLGARLGMGLGWASVIVAELAVGVGASSTVGIGQLMFTYYQYESDPNPIVVCMIAVGLTGFGLDMVLRECGRLLSPWIDQKSTV